MEDACRRVGRDAADVTLMAVSKGVPASLLTSAVAVGLDLFGENRVQEAAAKIPAVPAATWHLVGRLQGNKAARALELFATIHSVDSLDLARRLDRLADVIDRATPYPVFLQVNVDEDLSKAGFSPAALGLALDGLVSLPNLELRGLMTIGRMGGRPEAGRPTFRRLRGLAESLHSQDSRLGAGLSMGMSDDFEVAVEEGATVVRIGRALFGDRLPH
ncbi:MAG: YggS family pyridoxal phosphate-dependent enzyme [Chloroflexota bacterium]|nr:YggS family pyridoxal phosphate-dependent enzyme [Chloroflexota bacterium]